MSGRAELNSSSFAGDMVVAADKAAEPLRERVDYASVGDARRDHDQHAITAIFMKTVIPRYASMIEGFFQNLVQLLV
jgi:hypothetical protein